MKLRQLQCLCAVVDAGYNFSRAADVLHATQPAVSKQLRQFEDELGLDLLLRQGGRPVGLTDAGERTLAWARKALQCTDNIRSMAREGAAGDGSITIATSHAHAMYLLLPSLVAFRRRSPKVRISVVQGTPVQVAEFVRDGKVGFGVTHLPAHLPAEIVAAPFLTSGRVLVAPADHPLLKSRAMTLEAIAQHPLVIQHSSRAQGSRIVEKFRQAGLEVNVAVQALDADVVKASAAVGLGVGIVPAWAFDARRDRGLRGRDVGSLFDPSESAVLLRRDSHLQQYVFQFMAELSPTLNRDRIESLVFGAAVS